MKKQKMQEMYSGKDMYLLEGVIDHVTVNQTSLSVKYSVKFRNEV